MVRPTIRLQNLLTGNQDKVKQHIITANSFLITICKIQ